MRETLRKVKGKAYRDDEWIEFDKAYFHQWGSEVCEDGSYTVAVVELDDGSICTTAPSYIAFITK